jgi:hypothetical protein
MKPIITLSFGAFAAAAISVQATTITFDDQGFANLQACTSQYAGSGVTFAGVADDGSAVSLDVSDSSTFNDVNPYSAPFSLANFYDNNSSLRANILRIIFNAPVDFVTFEYNPAGELGSKTVFNAYGAGNSLLGSYSDATALLGGNWYVEGFSLSGITEVDIVNPASGWAYYIDDLSFRTGAAGVPDGGSTLALLGFGLATVAWLGRTWSAGRREIPCKM